MEKIISTNGFIILVDKENYNYLSKFSWTVRKWNTQFYAFTYDLKRVTKNKTDFMHRFLISARRGQMVDHVNGDGLDNRKSNLRIANKSQNAQNSKKRSCKTSSKFKGVSWKKDKKKWKSYITVNKKQVHLGYFDSEIEAAKTYDKAALKYFKSFSRPNFRTNL